MAIGASESAAILSAISSIAVIASAFFIILQLWQNSKVIRATLHQEKSTSRFPGLKR